MSTLVAAWLPRVVVLGLLVACHCYYPSTLSCHYLGRAAFCQTLLHRTSRDNVKSSIRLGTAFGQPSLNSRVTVLIRFFHGFRWQVAMQCRSSIASFFSGNARMSPGIIMSAWKSRLSTDSLVYPSIMHLLHREEREPCANLLGRFQPW